MAVSEFSTRTVSKITGVTPRQLDYWADTGFIVPSVQIGAGRGKVRLYAFIDLVQVKVAKRLADAGITLQKMRKAVSKLRELAPDIERPLAQFEFLSDGRDVYVAYDETRMVAITDRLGQFYWRLKVGDLVRDLISQVQDLAQVEEATVSVDGQEYPVVMYRDLDSDWWIGQCTTIRGCVTQGKTRQELREMLAEAIALCLEPSRGWPLRWRSA